MNKEEKNKIISKMEFVIINDNNETDLINRCIELNLKHVCLVYSKFNKDIFDKVKKLDLKYDIELYCAILIKKINEINKKFVEFDFIIGDGCRTELFMCPKIDAIINLEIIPKKDSVFQRNSGFNHIFAEEFIRTNKRLFFNFNNVLKGHNKGQVLGRIFQNYRLCKKYGIYCKLGSFSNSVDKIRNLTCIDFERIWKGY